MPRPRGPDVDWRRLSRWCLLGTVVMACWLMAPVARCSFAAFRDTPLTQLDATQNEPGALQGDDPSQADRKRVTESQGFAEKVGSSMKLCYQRTPMFGQEPWKSDLLVGLAIATVIARLLFSITNSSRRTYG